jgi:hypothetical protein
MTHHRIQRPAIHTRRKNSSDTTLLLEAARRRRESLRRLAHCEQENEWFAEPMIVKKSRAAGGESHADGDTLANGCRYCGYAHARMELQADVSEAELHDLLPGDLRLIPEYELAAVLFAPHDAEQSDRYEAAAWRLQDTYGLEAVTAILAHIRMITFSMRVWFRHIGIEEYPAASAWATTRKGQQANLD